MKKRWKLVFKSVRSRYGYIESFIVYRHKNSEEFNYLFHG